MTEPNRQLQGFPSTVVGKLVCVVYFYEAGHNFARSLVAPSRCWEVRYYFLVSPVLLKSPAIYWWFGCYLDGMLVLPEATSLVLGEGYNFGRAPLGTYEWGTTLVGFICLIATVEILDWAGTQ